MHDGDYYNITFHFITFHFGIQKAIRKPVQAISPNTATEKLPVFRKL